MHKKGINWCGRQIQKYQAKHVQKHQLGFKVWFGREIQFCVQCEQEITDAVCPKFIKLMELEKWSPLNGGTVRNGQLWISDMWECGFHWLGSEAPPVQVWYQNEPKQLYVHYIVWKNCIICSKQLYSTKGKYLSNMFCYLEELGGKKTRKERTEWAADIFLLGKGLLK